MITGADPSLYIIGGVFLGWNIILTILFWRIITHYQRLAAKTKKGNLETVLDTLLKDEKETNGKLKQLEEAILKIDKQVDGHYQKSGLVKYNPFSNTGGNQSFSLVVLNGNNNGLMITSLYGRDSTRIYAKPIIKGKGAGGDLSKEEQLAVNNALGGKKL